MSATHQSVGILARQAFSVHDFGLAAELFEKTIHEVGPQPDLYLSLADSFAKGGNFVRAFNAYSLAFGLERFAPEKLRYLVSSLIETVKQEKSAGQYRNTCLFTCYICRGLLILPVTIPCGHTFCKKCFLRLRNESNSCRLCEADHGTLNVSQLKPNILLSDLISKYFGDECEANRLRSEGNRYFEKKEFLNAIQYYDKAISIVPDNHLLLGNRSLAYSHCNKHPEALQDADHVIRLEPTLPKAYFRRGSALQAMGEHEDAVVALLQCLALDPTSTPTRRQLSQALHAVISSISSVVLESSEQLQTANQSRLRQLISCNFDATKLFPNNPASTACKDTSVADDPVVTTTDHITVADSDHIAIATDSDSMPKSTRDPIAIATDYDNTTTTSTTIETNSYTIAKATDADPITTATGTETITMTATGNTNMPMTDMKIPDRIATGVSHRKPDEADPDVTMDQLDADHERPLVSSSDHVITKDGRRIPRHLLDVDDYECGLCYRLFYDPVTTPCGHVFCRQCLDRCLDHNSTCPLCKCSLTEYLAERRRAVTEAVQMIVQSIFPEEFKERKQIHEDEMSDLARMGSDTRHTIPVFVCVMSFPTILCPLHIFEPRYRLMIRRCMESGSRQFGMCMPRGPVERNYADVGTMLEIRDIQFLSDGRSLVDTIGGRRFRVLERGNLDGYHTAVVEFLLDEEIAEEDLAEVKALEDEVYTLSQSWFQGLSWTDRQRIIHKHGVLPEREQNIQSCPNGPTWSWWILRNIPLNHHAQLSFLAITSYKDRILALKGLLSHLTNSPGR